MKRTIILLFTLVLTAALWAQTDCPVVEHNGREYYQYTIQKGDGLYAIGKRFNVTQAELFQANPGLKESIREGDKLLIPIKQKRRTRTAEAQYHVVTDRQTPYSIARMYNIPLDTLIRYNPSIRSGIIKTGDSLVVAYGHTIVPDADRLSRASADTVVEIPETIVVKARETLYSISRTYNIPIHDLIDLNPEVENGLKKGQTIRLKASAPKSQAVTAEAETKGETKGEAVKPATAAGHPLRIAYILPFTNDQKVEQTFVEFYRGSLLALDRARASLRRDIEVWAWNTHGQRAVLDSILALDALKQADVVIGPGFTHELDQVLAYCKRHNKKVIVPFSSKIDKAWYNDNLYQFNPPQELWWRRAIRQEINRHPAQKYIIAYPGVNQQGRTFASETMAILRDMKLRFVQVDITAENADSLLRVHAQEKCVMLLANSSGPEVRPIVQRIVDFRPDDLTLWGFGRWGATAKLYNPTFICSLFHDRADQAYEDLYLEHFKHRAPKTPDVRFDLLGYDITTFAVDPDGRYLQSDLNFVKQEGRWLNQTAYLLYWNGSNFYTE